MSALIGTFNVNNIECKNYIINEVEKDLKIINGIAGYNTALNDQQKAALTGSIERMVELHNRVIYGQVQEGSISKEQGNRELQAIKDIVSGFKNCPGMSVTGSMMGFK